MFMKIVTLTRGGQVSIPAEYRRGWTTNRVMVKETPGGLLLRPVPDDPLAAAAGSLKHLLRPGETAESMMREYRLEEREAEERKWKHLDRP